MRIGIDISQIVYEGTGVARYVKNIVQNLLDVDYKNNYILFGASLRKQHIIRAFYQKISQNHKNVQLRLFPIPPSILSIMWNQLHIFPIELFLGKLDVFWSSDWTQPPLTFAHGITTIHDLIVLKHPKETDAAIVTTQRKRLNWVGKECKVILCDSESTKKDVLDLLRVAESRLQVIYPGFSP